MEADPEKLVGLAGITRAYVRKLHALSFVLDRADDREHWLQAHDRPVVILTPLSLPSGPTRLDAWASQPGRAPTNVRRIHRQGGVEGKREVVRVGYGCRSTQKQ